MASLSEFNSDSEDDTFKIGQYIASVIKTSASWRANKPNFIIALSGELGSGKTALTKGIAAGFEITDCITSPTYTIINEYQIREQGAGSREQILYHIDAYRLNNEKEFEDIGGHEILSSNGICVIEWADKIKNLLPGNTITVNIEITGNNTRKITITKKEGHGT